MSYTTAVTNRTSASYLNVSDWTRIYRNAQLASALAEISLGTPIAFNAATAPTTTTDPRTLVTPFNTLLANIERLRLAVAGESIPGTSTEIKDDYEAGKGKQVFSYVEVNLWESTIDAIWTYFDGPDLTGPLTLSTDLTVATGVTLIVMDSIDTNGNTITVNGTGKLYII